MIMKSIVKLRTIYNSMEMKLLFSQEDVMLVKVSLIIHMNVQLHIMYLIERK